MNNDTIAGVIAKWREYAQFHDEAGNYTNVQVAITYRNCAEDIEAWQAAQPSAAVGEIVPPTFYYMRDNHTFKKLTNDVSLALAEIEHEINSGHPYGMLCSNQNGFQDVQYRERMQFLADCKAALTAALTEPSPCDMGKLCLDCQPRRADGSCPDAPPKEPQDGQG